MFEPNHCLIYDAFGSIAKADEGVFLGYAIYGHPYRVYNKRLMTIEESIHVVFDETNPKLQDQMSKNANEEDMMK